MSSLEDVGPMPAAGGGDYYVPPTRGNSQAQVWTTNSQIPVDHLVGGSFDSAARVSISRFGYLTEQLFLFLVSHGQSKKLKRNNFGVS